MISKLVKIEPQSSSQEEIEKLRINLNKKKQRVITLEQHISFRGKGGAGKYTAELIKTRAEVQDIQTAINRRNMIEDDKITEAFLKDYDEREKVRKEQERVLALFEEFKENTNKPPELKISQKPDFTEVGVKWKKERNLHEKLKIVQKALDMAKLRAENSSPVGKSGRTAYLQQTRNELDFALKSVEKEAGNIEFYNLRAEVEWNEAVKTELEEYKLELQACINKIKADFALFEKHGLINQKLT